MPGKILIEAAYAAGKMLDHSGWHGRLPRGITPSDGDMIFDNNGRFLFVELKSSTADWSQISTGQRRLYTGLISALPQGSVAVLARHRVPDQRPIDSLRDILEFSWMRLGDDGHIEYSRIWGGNNWPMFVSRWYTS